VVAASVPEGLLQAESNAFYVLFVVLNGAGCEMCIFRVCVIFFCNVDFANRGKVDDWVGIRV